MHEQERTVLARAMVVRLRQRNVMAIHQPATTNPKERQEQCRRRQQSAAKDLKVGFGVCVAVGRTKCVKDDTSWSETTRGMVVHNMCGAGHAHCRVPEKSMPGCPVGLEARSLIGRLLCGEFKRVSVAFTAVKCLASTHCAEDHDAKTLHPAVHGAKKCERRIDTTTGRKEANHKVKIHYVRSVTGDISPELQVHHHENVAATRITSQLPSVDTQIL